MLEEYGTGTVKLKPEPKVCTWDIDSALVFLLQVWLYL